MRTAILLLIAMALPQFAAASDAQSGMKRPLMTLASGVISVKRPQ